MVSLVYNAAPTLSQFHRSAAFGRWVIGPYGSGKSTAMLMELFKTAAAQKPGPDGIRRTRMAIIRNTLPMLKSTTLQDVLQLLRPICEFHVSENTIKIRAGDIHSDWVLMPLEDVDDQRRLLSMQLTMAFLEEFREINFNLLPAISGRTGRFPSPAMGGPSRFGVIGSSNPFAVGTDWHRFLVLDRPTAHDLFIQPSGVSPEAENVENLPDGYYTRLIDGYSAEWCDVHVHGNFGDDLSGTTVFKRSFSHDRHVAPGLLTQPLRPVLIGLDLGRTPTAVLGQTDARGRVLVTDSVTSEDMGLESFLSERLIPLLTTDKYIGKRAMVFFDPSGVARGQLTELNAWDTIKRAGLISQPAPTNDLTIRLRAVESLLLQNRGDSPAILFDRDGCADLINALRFEYKYKRRKTGQVEDIPAKTHPWSDLADALQYLCLAVAVDLPTRMAGRLQAPAQQKRRASALGWT